MKKLICLLLALLMGLSSAVAETEDEKKEQYYKAMDLFEAEDYGEAYEIFASLGSYRESKKYRDLSEMRFQRAEYKRAKDLFNEGSYHEALAVFESLGRYEDSRDRAEKAREKIAELELIAYEQECYQKGVELLEKQEWEAARDMFIQAGKHEGATEGMYEAVRGLALRDVTQKAQAAYDQQRYREAMYLYQALGEEEKANECLEKSGGTLTDDDIIGHAKALQLLWKDEEANTLLEPLGKYGDADLLIEKVTYPIPAIRLRDDNTTEKSDVFTAPDGSRHQYQIFKGVHKWVEAKTFCEILGGHLATLTSNEENEFVYWFMRDNDFLTAYFGLSDERRVGNWIWVTGEPVEYTNWHRGEPSRSGKERYGMYFYKHLKGTWNDAHFYEDAEVDPGCSFICEWDLDD